MSRFQRPSVAVAKAKFARNVETVRTFTLGCGCMETDMPRGSKATYTPKQRRQAEHIEKSYEKRGVSEGEAEARAARSVAGSRKHSAQRAS
jgi:hypothetical protein